MDDVEAVVALEREVQTPQCRHDRARLAALLAEDVEEVGASGRVWSRAELIELMVGEEPDAAPIVMRDLTGRVISEGVVLVRWDSLRDGRRARRSSLWRREPSWWRLVHHQGTLLG